MNFKLNNKNICLIMLFISSSIPLFFFVYMFCLNFSLVSFINFLPFFAFWSIPIIGVFVLTTDKLEF
jgi:hypothetical protein